jgi:eukaryotic-like serine/threonine-protein kinase
MSFSPGERLGPYEIVALIGAGGMGEVWKARDTRLGRIVAIKRLKGEHGERFQQEARAVAALNHPHICQIYDVGPDYLVLEFIDGKPLAGPLPVEDAVRLAIQIASALEEAHGRGILHRDLKPANILVTPKGSAKLLDFGLAKPLTGTDATRTIEGTIVGTPAYMAPEQIEGKPCDARSDVFSFGAVIYEMLAGSRAFDGMAAVLRDEPKPPPALESLELKRLVLR